MMDIQIIELENGGFAYKVGGVYQETNPETAGNALMTEAEANAFALVVAARLGV